MRQSKACSDVSPSRRLRIPSIPYSLFKERRRANPSGAFRRPPCPCGVGGVSTGMPPPSQAIRFSLFYMGISIPTHCFYFILHVTRWSYPPKTGLRMHRMRILHGFLGGQSPAIRFCLCKSAGASFSTSIDSAFLLTPTRTRSPSFTVPARMRLASRFCNSRWMIRLSGRAP